MKQISSLFEKYKKTLRPPQSSVEKEVVAVISHITSITITTDQVSYSPSTKTVKLLTPSIVRSEVLKQKAAIIAALQSSMSQAHAPRELL